MLTLALKSDNTILIYMLSNLSVHNPGAAGQAANRIRKAVGKLLDHPLIGSRY